VSESVLTPRVDQAPEFIEIAYDFADPLDARGDYRNQWTRNQWTDETYPGDVLLAEP
jgi:hypothetical protein